jgi:hypothetical protein
MTKLNEGVVKSLQAPNVGNRVHDFPDAVLQGTKTPPGFGVHITDRRSLFHSPLPRQPHRAAYHDRTMAWESWASAKERPACSYGR